MQSIYNLKDRVSALLSLLIISGLITIMSCKSSQSSTIRGKDSISLLNVSADTLTKDTVLQFKARSKDGFNFGYLIYLPKGLHLNQALTPIVETTNTGPNDSIEH